MAAQIPINQTTQNAIRITPDNSGVRTALSSVLQVGRVLDVTVGRNFQSSEKKELGVYIKGKFLNASLPDNVSSGDKLQVTVVENSDVLILKILGSKASQQSGAASKTGLGAYTPSFPGLEDDISALLKDSNAQQLSVAFRALSDRAAVSSGLNREEGIVAEKIALAFSKLYQNSNIINDSSFEAPQVLYKALLNLGFENLLANIADAQKALNALSKDLLQPAHSNFIKALEEHIKRALEKKDLGPPTKEQSHPDQQAPGELGKGELGKGELGSEKTTTPNLPSIARESYALRPTNPLLSGLSTPLAEPINNLLEVLAQVKGNITDSAGPKETELKQFITNLSRDLNLAARQSDPDKAIRTVLNEALQLLQEKFDLKSLNTNDSSNLNSAHRALVGLENLISSQETLTQLNKVMEAIGEPVFILFPFLTSGLISKSKMTVNMPPVGEDGQRNPNQSGSGYTVISINIPLPALGDVQVELAHNHEEVFINLTFADENISEFVNSKIQKLESSLKELGYENVSFSVTTDRPKDVSPEWIKDLLGQDFAVA